MKRIRSCLVTGICVLFIVGSIFKIYGLLFNNSDINKQFYLYNITKDNIIYIYTVFNIISAVVLFITCIFILRYKNWARKVFIVICYINIFFALIMYFPVKKNINKLINVAYNRTVKSTTRNYERKIENNDLTARQRAPIAMKRDMQLANIKMDFMEIKKNARGNPYFVIKFYLLFAGAVVLFEYLLIVVFNRKSVSKSFS